MLRGRHLRLLYGVYDRPIQQLVSRASVEDPQKAVLPPRVELDVGRVGSHLIQPSSTTLVVNTG